MLGGSATRDIASVPSLMGLKSHGRTGRSDTTKLTTSGQI